MMVTLVKDYIAFLSCVYWLVALAIFVVLLGGLLCVGYG
jgi:hypothetical protein